MGYASDVLRLGVGVGILLLGTVWTGFSAIGALVDPTTALVSWYDVYFPVALTCLAVGVGLAWWSLSRWPRLAPSGVWNVALLGFGGAMIGAAAGVLLRLANGAPTTPALAAILRGAGWGLGLLVGVIAGERREWLVRDNDRPA